MNSQSIIELESVSFNYGKENVLEDINLSIKQGSFVGILGPNGGGKTTFIKIILGLLQPNKGSVTILHQPISKFKEWNHIGFVSQKANTFNTGFPATVFEVVRMGLTAQVGYLKFFTKKHRDQVIQAIEQVGMADYIYESIGNLSGGQQQRVFIARAIVSNPKLLILDEPTVGVDYKNIERFYKLLHQLHKKNNITILLVTHDSSPMLNFATHILCMNQTLKYYGKTENFVNLTDEDLSKIFDQSMSIMNIGGK